MRISGSLGLVAAFVGHVAAFALLGCEAPPPPPPAPPAVTTTRPPQPTMAQAGWGERVALDLGKNIDISGIPEQPIPELFAAAESRLLSLRPGDERAARPFLVAAWKRAQDDQARGTALAMLAASLVYEPTVEGYIERLTDAFGLAQYAGSVDTSATNNHAARAIVANAAGATHQGQDMVAMIKRIPRFPEASLPWLALARAAGNDRGQPFFDDANAALVARPDAWRVRLALVDRLLDLGFADDATATATAVEGAPAAVGIAAARARVASGNGAAAVAVLEGFEKSLAGVDEPGRSEAMYWLAEAKLQAGDLVGAKATAAALEQRPGWQREAGLLAASLALLDGRVDDAAAMFVPMISGTPVSTVLVERRIGLLALLTCAEKADVVCVDKAARFLRIVDVDAAAIDAAKARAGRAVNGDAAAVAAAGPAIWKQGSAPLPLELAARRAMATGATGLAKKAVAQAVAASANAREARALQVAIATSGDEKANAAVAALQGAGPPLSERDLLVVIDALGAAATKTGGFLLKQLKAGASPAVLKAIARAEQDLANPAARAKREAEEKGGAGAAGHTDHGDHDGHDGVDPRGPKP